MAVDERGSQRRKSRRFGLRFGADAFLDGFPGTAIPMITLLAIAACGDPVGPGAEPITRLPRELSAAELSVIDASTDFGLGLLRETIARDDRPNVVISPLSASMALGMTLNGAVDETFDAMSATLGFEGLTLEEINQAYRDLIGLLQTLDPSIQFEIANAIWTNQKIPFHEAFLSLVAEAFDAEAGSRDFADPATLEEINNWVARETNGLIEEILESLDPLLAALLVNAIYFEGEWTNRFDPADTERRPFTRPDGSQVEVDMMSIEDLEVEMGGGSGYRSVELPYGGGAYTMVIVLPDGDASDFATQMGADVWEEIVGGFTPATLGRLSIPKFTLTFDTYLNEPLQAIGMLRAFTSEADFSRMSPEGHRMCIDFVRQKTFIEVDERGTRAAAVTAVGIGLESAPPALVVDRPFIFAIRERLSGTVLFSGLVTDPTAEDPGPEGFESQCG